MLIIEQYFLYRSSTHVIHITNDNEPQCPACGNLLRFIGTYRRKLRDSEYRDDTFIVRKLRCDACKSIHAELPSLFIPYKQYSRKGMEDAVYNPNTSFSGEESTIRRWRAFLSGHY